MVCKKCGQPLVEGQVICSNCDTDNSDSISHTQVGSQQDSYSSFYSPNNTQGININADFNNLINNNSYNDSNNENNKQSKSSKSASKIIISIIVTGFVILFIIAIIFVIVQKLVIKSINKNKPQAYVENYEEIRSEVIKKINNDNVVTCDDDCNYVYETKLRDSAEFEVTDMGNFYKIEYEVDDDAYKGFEFTKDICAVLEDSVCNKNEIIGRVYKN